MKKVFRIWKYVEAMHKLGADEKCLESLKAGWPFACEGMARDETHFILMTDWLVEEDE